MITVTLNPNEAIRIEFAETDGHIDVRFSDHRGYTTDGKSGHELRNPYISVSADFPDDQRREGEIYHASLEPGPTYETTTTGKRIAHTIEES